MKFRRLEGLFFFKTGLWEILPLTQTNHLFSFMLYYYKTYLSPLTPLISVYYIYMVKKGMFVQLIEDTQTGLIKYARAYGSYAKLISINFTLQTVLIELPSKARKLFLLNTLVYKMPLVKINQLPIMVNKAGFNKNFGLKSKVRGVAKNPVDHPHGGRTKTIKYPRTP
jgi:ribosomal protein L2